VYQAAEALQHFTGVEPDAERMYAHLESLLAKDAS
jgi:shikimate dehydrogenase